MDKSPDAFRTISEVAEALDTPAHVLRFWETRFPQVRPVKRAGGRRYYRPSDLALLAGIRRLLHDEGMTIRGVQKLLREQGIRYVAEQAGSGPGGVYEPDLSIIASYAGDVPPLSPAGGDEALPDEPGMRELPDAGPPVAPGLYKPAPEARPAPLPEAEPQGAQVITFPTDQTKDNGLDDMTEGNDRNPSGIPGTVAEAEGNLPATAADPVMSDTAAEDAEQQPVVLAEDPVPLSLSEEAGPVPESAVGPEEDLVEEAPFAFDVEAEPSEATQGRDSARVMPLIRPAARQEDSAPLQSTLAARLRAIPRGALSAHREELQAYSALIRELQQRLAASQLQA